jgi:hypothetical protein
VDYQVSHAITQIGDVGGKDHHEGRLVSTGRPVIPIVKTFARAIDHQLSARVVSRSISSVERGGVRAI